MFHKIIKYNRLQNLKQGQSLLPKTEKGGKQGPSSWQCVSGETMDACSIIYMSSLLGRCHCNNPLFQV